MMESLINLEEQPGKTVGKRRGPIDTLDASQSRKENARAWAALSGVKPIPSGVYRFHSHEEADAWMMKMLTRR